jgi:hypothetical protein
MGFEKNNLIRLVKTAKGLPEIETNTKIVVMR